MGTGTRIWVSGDWDLGIPGPGSGCQRFPGTGIWGLGGLGGQILDTYIQFEGLGIEIRVSGFGDWNPWTGTWVSWDLGGLGSGDYGRGSEARSLTHSSNLRGLGLGSGHLGTGSGHPGTGIWGSGDWDLEVQGIWGWDEWIWGLGEARRPDPRYIRQI